MKLDFSPIRHIIFDLGGVLLDIHYAKTVEAFGRLGLKDPDQAFSKAHQADIFQKFERGQVGEEAFLQYLQGEMKMAKPEALIAGWNAMLGDFDKERLSFISAIQSRYNCFVLSNTNIIHQRAFEKIIDESVGWESFSSVFQHIYYSHHTNLRKPEGAIFQKVLQEQGLDPKETVFIDDSPQHVEAAKKLGILGIHLKEGEEIWDVIPEPATFS